MPDKLPQLYFNDKKSMFMRAHSKNQRDWSAFFNQAIGLPNARIRAKLRKTDLTTNKGNANKLGKEVVFWARIICKSFQLGELHEAKVYGAEANLSIFSYIGGRIVKGLVL